jgi:ATP-dependent DNA helicase RecG
MIVGTDWLDAIDWRLKTLPGVGAKTLASFQAADIHNLWQLACHIPMRYEDYTHLTPSGAWHLHLHKEAILIEGQVQKTWAFFSSGKRLTYCQLQSGDQSVRIGFFHLHPQIKKQMEQKGALLRCYGSLVLSGHVLSMYHPNYWLIDGANPTPLQTTLTPIYKAISGVSASRLQKIMGEVIRRIQTIHHLLVPKNSEDLTVGQAIQCLHAPQKSDLGSEGVQGSKIERAHFRLAEEEAAFWRSLLSKESKKVSSEAPSQRCIPSIVTSAQLSLNFIGSLPFQLTQDQRQAWMDIQQDLQRHIPMRRLLQGDVGSGKTVVATLAMLEAIDAGFQAALLVPTVVLARQHVLKLQTWLAPLGVSVELLIAESGDQFKEKKQKIAEGKIALIVGTHALLSVDVVFKSLALVVIDEQHRFGVKQRQSLIDKGIDQQSHVLMMSATPIPRSLAQAMFGISDCSFIKTKPDHRKKIQTSVMSSQKREEVLKRVLEQAQSKKQVYWVCPRVDEAVENLDWAGNMSAVQWFEKISAMNHCVRVALLHGRMKVQEKMAVLESFSKGDIDVLVSTVVIEVGVDVPTATIMVIDQAQMFGLAQLHQLRGRVGRSDLQSYCILLYDQRLTQEGVARLQCLKACDDGFELAEKDLAMRGPGHLLGFKQSGYPAWRFLQWPKHQDLLAHRSQAEVIADAHSTYAVKLLWTQSNAPVTAS